MNQPSKETAMLLLQLMRRTSLPKILEKQRIEKANQEFQKEALEMRKKQKGKR